jgi:oligopeptide/dipeptide ABC transporter ATP-binding protein
VIEGAALEVEGLAVEFAIDHDVVRAVSDVSFAVAPGETVAIVGESGSGKTVTALAIMGLIDRPGSITAGDIRLAGRSLVGASESAYRQVRGRDLAMVFQDPMTALNPVMRVGDQIAEAIAVHSRARSRRNARGGAVELLERVGITPAAARAREYPHPLSGGMRQRVMVAMALANAPQVLIADEPTTALDVTTQAQILELLGELQREMGLALVIVTHDLGVVAGLADRVVVMYAGRVVEEGPVDALFTSSGHPYTRALLASVPRRGDARGELRAIAGAPPDPAHLPSGCAFHPRCPMAEPPCREQVPELRVLSEDHRAACLFAERVARS